MHGRSGDSDFFGSASIGQILRRIAPPVMLAQLIQSLYNIVDSFFVGKYSAGGEALIRTFGGTAEVQAIGRVAFPIIGTCFLPAVFSLMMPVFFQAIGDGRTSAMLSLTRQIFCLIPLFWLFSLIGLNYTWIAFPLSETITGVIGLLLYRRTLRTWTQRTAAAAE